MQLDAPCEGLFEEGAAARWMSSTAKDASLDGLDRAGKGIRDMGLSCQTLAKWLEKQCLGNGRPKEGEFPAARLAW